MSFGFAKIKYNKGRHHLLFSLSPGLAEAQTGLSTAVEEASYFIRLTCYQESILPTTELFSLTVSTGNYDHNLLCSI